MRLAELEDLFWRFVRHEPVESDLVRRAFCPGERLSANERLSIYRGMYWARSIAALAESFPLLHQRLGDEGLGALTRAYLAEFPSQDPRLEWLGQHLPRFLRRHAEPDWRALADLAAYEWAVSEVFLAPDPPALVERFEVDPAIFPQCRLEMVPALRLLRLSMDPSDPLALPDPEGERHHLAIWRRHLTVSSIGLAPDEAAAAGAAAGGATMAEVCAHFAASDGGLRAAEVVRAWLTRRWVARIT